MTNKPLTAGDDLMIPHLFQSCIDSARAFQKKLMNLFGSRSYASLQLVEALAHASKPTTVVELSQETPFQRSYSVINKVLDEFAPEYSPEEANWQLPVSVERISTDTTACKVAATQLQLLAKSTLADSLLNVIVADCAYGSLEPSSKDQVVIARGRTDRQGRRPAKNSQGIDKKRGRPRKYEPGTIRFIEDMPPDTEGGSDEEYECEDIIKNQRVNVLFNRWNDVHVEGHSELVDVVKVEIFAKDDYEKTLLPPLLLILSGKRRKEITSLEAYQSYQRRFDIEHFFRFAKQKLLFCAYQTPDLDHQISWWWFCCMAYWLLYHVRHMGQGSTRQWYKRKDPTRPAGPGEVKRLFATSIFPALGSPAAPPISTEKSRGRESGTRLPKREQKKVVKKGKKLRKAA